MQKLIHLSIVLSIITGCSSAPVKIEVPPLCSGKMPSQKYVWTIAFSQGVPKGMELSRISEFVKVRSELYENVVESFVQGLIFLSSNNGAYEANNSNQQNHALNLHASYLADQNSSALIETGSSNFVFCKWDNCEELTDPVNGSSIKKMPKEIITNYWLSPMYYVEGIIDPADSKFRDFRSSSSSAPTMHVYWREYFERRPFLAGEFLSNHYFVVPESKRSELCQKAGFEKDCFASPKYDFQNDLVTPLSCNIRDSRCRIKFAALTPYRHEFLMNNNGLCGTSCLDDTNTMLKKLKEDPHFRLQWENAIAKDIFLKLSISTTRKVEKDWQITRVEWNPTPFCQHANPNTNLLSQ